MNLGQEFFGDRALTELFPACSLVSTVMSPKHKMSDKTNGVGRCNNRFRLSRALLREGGLVFHSPSTMRTRHSAQEGMPLHVPPANHDAVFMGHRHNGLPGFNLELHILRQKFNFHYSTCTLTNIFPCRPFKSTKASPVFKSHLSWGSVIFSPSRSTAPCPSIKRRAHRCCSPPILQLDHQLHLQTESCGLGRAACFSGISSGQTLIDKNTVKFFHCFTCPASSLQKRATSVFANSTLTARADAFSRCRDPP